MHKGVLMKKKINKNYLTKALEPFDSDGNQIIEPQEWLEYFNAISNPNTQWETVKKLLTNILIATFPNEESTRIPVLVNAIILSHAYDSGEEKRINFIQLYNYIIRFIAPQKYREYQDTLEDKKQFFLYDGVIEQEEFDMFTNSDNRLISADIYYAFVSYHINPYIVAQIIEQLKKDPLSAYKADDFSMDAEGVFNILSITKNDKAIIDIDALIDYTKKCNIKHSRVEDICHLFGIHNDHLKTIQQTGKIDYNTAYCFFNYHNKIYLELAIQSLFEAMNIALEDSYDILKILDFMGIIGKADKIFHAIAGEQKYFIVSDMIRFLDNNQIPYELKK